MTDTNQCLDQINTPFNACSLETHPSIQSDTKDATIPLVIGCYQLSESNADDESATRSGELRLYTIFNEVKLSFNEPYVVNMESGVLDGKWKRRSGERSLFASASASGRIHLHSLEYDSGAKSWKLDHKASSIVEGDTGALCLALTWDDYSNDNHMSDRIVSSYSDGTVALHDVLYSTNQIKVEEYQRWEAHSMFGCPSEVWTCSFLRGDENIVMSGADDCCLKVWDIRQTRNASQTINKEFEAGITAISSHPYIERMFAVGSYDEYVRLYDCRMLKEPFWKVHVGGGVWRIKWHPLCSKNCANTEKLLVASMHGGCRVIQCNDLHNSSEMPSAEVVSSFTEHKSMVYGADWVLFDKQDSIREVAATCSFYDRQAYLWSPKECL